MYIGVYTDHIVFRNGNFPAPLLQLTFVFRLRIDDYSTFANKHLSFALFDPTGSQISAVEGALPPAIGGDRLNLQFRVSNISFPTPGAYVLKLNVDDEVLFHDNLKITGPEPRVGAPTVGTEPLVEDASAPDG